MSRLRLSYNEKVVPALIKSRGYKTKIQVPRLSKIVINAGVGEATQNAKIMDVVSGVIANVAGQKPVIRKSKKSIANFKLRENLAIGCCVTLRGTRMYEFMDRLIAIALPRVRDFRGVPKKGFDGNGNYTLGIKDYSVFPEAGIGEVEKMRGFQISFVTSAASDDEARDLLTELGLPFRK